MRTNPPRAQSIVGLILSIVHPADPVMLIILQLIRPSVRAANDPSSSSIGRPSPTFRPIIHPSVRAADDPSSSSVGRPSPTFHPIVRPTNDPIILSLIHPIIRAFDDPLVLSVRRPSPTFHPIVRPTNDPTSLPFICPIIHPNDDPFILSDPAFRPIIHPTDDSFIQSVRRPSPIQSDPSVHPTIFHGNHLNRPPDLTLNSLESSEEGYSTAVYEGPVILQVEKESFLFHTFET